MIKNLVYSALLGAGMALNYGCGSEEYKVDFDGIMKQEIKAHPEKFRLPAKTLECTFQPKIESKNSSSSLDSILAAQVQIESNGNPNAVRHEKNKAISTYGVSQMSPETALELRTKHPYLHDIGKTRSQIIAHLRDPVIAQEYQKQLMTDEFDFYGDTKLALSAYNAGHYAPQHAAAQEMLNIVYHTKLKTDGDMTSKNNQTKRWVLKFQKENHLRQTGFVGNETYSKLCQVVKKKNPKYQVKKGIIPNNPITPDYVNKITYFASPNRPYI